MKKVHAEWYEYKTLPIYVVSQQNLYNALLDNIGVKLCSISEDMSAYDERYYISNEEIRFLYYAEGYDDFAYNYVCFSNYNDMQKKPYNNFLAYLINPRNYDYGCYGENGFNYASDFTLRGEDLLAYIVDYSKSHEYVNLYDTNFVKNSEFFRNKYLTNDTDIVINYNGEQVHLNPNLFSGEVDRGRTIGYNNHNIDAEDTWDLIGFKDVSTSWQAFFGERKYADVSQKNIHAIEILNRNELSSLSKEQFCNKYYIGLNDYDEFRSFVNATPHDEKIVLFRFALTDYDAVYPTAQVPHSCGGVNTMQWDSDGHYTNVGELYYKHITAARETVFFNFDIIDLTFSKSGNYTVIPVVANPIQIVPDVAPPLIEETWQEILKDEIADLKNKFSDFFNKFKGLGSKILEVLKWVGIALAALFVVVIVGFLIAKISSALTNLRVRKMARNLNKGSPGDPHGGAHPSSGKAKTIKKSKSKRR